MTSSKMRIQTYLKKYKVSELFEEMMSKLVQDLPSKPTEYLVNFLQKRGVDSKNSELRKSGTFVHVKKKSSNTTSPSNKKSLLNDSNEKLRLETPPPTNITEADGQNETNRHYSKPWLSNSKKHINLKENEKDLERKKQTTSPSQKRSADSVTDEGPVDLELVYATPKIFGTPTERINEDNEIIEIKQRGYHRKDNKIASDVKLPTSLDKMKKKRQEEIRCLLAKKNSRSDMKTNTDDVQDEDDDTLELCESLNDLKNEGVKNPPKSGVYTSNMNQGKEEIELILNMSKFFDSLGGAVSVTELDLQRKSQVLFDNEEDFESASQVTGPRRPVWDAGKSDADSIISNSQKNSSRRVRASMFGKKSVETDGKSVANSRHSSAKGASVAKRGENGEQP